MRSVAKPATQVLGQLMLLLLLQPPVIPANKMAGCSHPWQMDLEVLFKGDVSSGPRRNLIGLADEESAQVLLTTSGDARLGLRSSASFDTEAELASSTGRLPHHRWVHLTLRLSTNADGGDTAWTLLLDGVPSARAPASAPPSLLGPLRATWLLAKNDTSAAVRNTFLTSGCNGTAERFNGGIGWPYFDACVGKSNTCPARCQCRATDGDNICSCPKATGCPEERYSLLLASHNSPPNATFDVLGDDVTFSSISGVTLTEGANYLTLRPPVIGHGRCFADGACPHCGFYVRLVFKTSLGYQDFALLYAGTLGLSVGVDAENRLVASLVSNDAEGGGRWTASGGVVAENEWCLAEILWHPELGGLRLMLNGRPVGQLTRPERLPMSAQPQPKDWHLGRDPIAAGSARPVMAEKQLTVLSLLVASTDRETLLAVQNISSLGGTANGPEHRTAENDLGMQDDQPQLGII